MGVERKEVTPENYLAGLDVVKSSETENYLVALYRFGKGHKKEAILVITRKTGEYGCEAYREADGSLIGGPLGQAFDDIFDEEELRKRYPWAKTYNPVALKDLRLDTAFNKDGVLHYPLHIGDVEELDDYEWFRELEEEGEEERERELSLVVYWRSLYNKDQLRLWPKEIDESLETDRDWDLL